MLFLTFVHQKFRLLYVAGQLNIACLLFRFYLCETEVVGL